MLLVFRHAESPYRAIEVTLHGLDAAATYELTYDTTGEKSKCLGSDLIKSLLINLPAKSSSEMITYRKFSQ